MANIKRKYPGAGKGYDQKSAAELAKRICMNSHEKSNRCKHINVDIKNENGRYVVIDTSE